MKDYCQLFKRFLVLFLRYIPFVRMHHRLRGPLDIVMDACELFHKHRDAINSQNFDALINRKLERLGINFRALPAEQKKDLYALLSNSTLSQESYLSLKQKLKIVPSELLSCKQWLRLHQMCCFRGRFSLANVFREKARELAISPLQRNGIEPPISWVNTIGAAIEAGDCETHQCLSDLIGRANMPNLQAKRWHLYLSLFSGEEMPDDLIKTFENSDFADFVENKSIAIVGPAPTNSLDANKIDSHDIVVRLNHSYDQKGTDSRCKGMRTDITCFNGEQTDALMSELSGKLPSEVTWACFKPPADIDFIQKQNPSKKIRSHISFHEAQSTQFHGFFNMMPIVALDFSLFKARSINIYHTDLMLTLNRQSGYYPSSFDYDHKMREIFLVGSVLHDPIQQYLIFSRLLSAKKISGDDRFIEVITMGLENYLLELEKIYTSVSD